MMNPDSTAPAGPFIIRTQAGHYNTAGTLVYYDIDVNVTGIYY